jgi:hypothetical protein
MTFSQRSIKSIIKKYYTGEISNETVIYVRDQLTKITEIIARMGMEKFYEKNKLRQKLGLKSKKRLDISSFKNITDKILIELNDKNLGEVDDLLCQDGVKK